MMQRIDDGACSYDTCPGVWVDDDGSVVVRGDLVDKARVPGGHTETEGAVRLPAHMVRAAAAHLEP
ncbi:MAG TPA: hypothetical protein VID07_01885 [Actinomycetes bacterium]|jgi:hypothetical protein